MNNAALLARLRAMNRPPHSTAHLQDPDLLQRLNDYWREQAEDGVSYDPVEDVEPVEAVKRPKRNTHTREGPQTGDQGWHPRCRLRGPAGR